MEEISKNEVSDRSTNGLAGSWWVSVSSFWIDSKCNELLPVSRRHQTLAICTMIPADVLTSATGSIIGAAYMSARCHCPNAPPHYVALNVKGSSLSARGYAVRYVPILAPICSLVRNRLILESDRPCDGSGKEV